MGYCNANRVFNLILLLALLESVWSNCDMLCRYQSVKSSVDQLLRYYDNSMRKHERPSKDILGLICLESSTKELLPKIYRANADDMYTKGPDTAEIIRNDLSAQETTISSLIYTATYTLSDNSLAQSGRLKSMLTFRGIGDERKLVYYMPAAKEEWHSAYQMQGDSFWPDCIDHLITAMGSSTVAATSTKNTFPAMPPGTGMCAVSSRCLNLLSTGSFQHYQATYRLYFISLLWRLNCIAELNANMTAMSYPFDDLRRTLYMNVENEVTELMRADKLQPSQIYLLGQQILTYTALNFLTLARFDLLDLFLYWQHPSGCFIKPSERIPRKPVFDSTRKKLFSASKCDPDTTLLFAGVMAIYQQLSLLESVDGVTRLNERLLLAIDVNNTKSLPALLSNDGNFAALHSDSPFEPSVDQRVLVDLILPQGFASSDTCCPPASPFFGLSAVYYAVHLLCVLVILFVFINLFTAFRRTKF